MSTPTEQAIGKLTRYSIEYSYYGWAFSPEDIKEDDGGEYVKIKDVLAALRSRQEQPTAQPAKALTEDQWKTRRVEFGTIVEYEGEQAVVIRHSEDDGSSNNNIGWVSIHFKNGGSNCVSPTSLAISEPMLTVEQVMEVAEEWVESWGCTIEKSRDLRKRLTAKLLS